MSQNQRNVSVYESQATYYNPVTKKWKDGLFRLNKTNLEFLIESKNDTMEHFHLSLPLSTISSLQKRQSSFIYSAVVVTVGSEKHWFASFHNRDTVYNLLELFWRGTLLSNSYKLSTPASSKKHSSKLGKELLNILHDSENTLVSAANALVDQGIQIQDTEKAVEDMNRDLSAADKLIKSMNYLPALPFVSRLRSSSSEQDQSSGSTEIVEMRQKHYKITFTLLKNSNECINHWEKGTLIISEDISICDENNSSRVLISRNQLENIQVVSPWEVQLNHTLDNKRESCNIMCPQLSSLLKFLTSLPRYKNKVLYDNEDMSVCGTPCSSTSLTQSPISSPSSPDVDLPIAGISESQTNMQITEELLSDEEMNEISNILNSLQTMAMEVGKEQKNQVEKINALIDDIDKTTLRINSSDKKMKKLI